MRIIARKGEGIDGESRVGDEGMKGINEGKKEVSYFDGLCSDVPKCIVVWGLLL